MKKYIRTKDGHIIDTSIYKKVVERTFNDKVVAIDLNHWGQDNDKCPTWIEAKHILKQADTIEELCDEFVGIDSQGHYIIHNDKFIEGARIIPLEKVNYYGAIWTDKGLIYVAKMNEKGELELS